MRLVAFIASVFLFSTPVFAQQAQFPVGPNQQMTPGALCTTPDSYRYPEHIPYCSRNVTTDTKNAVIRAYDQQLGYSIESMDRQDFKIDHLIPLCAGGANDETNLWPQHKTVYVITDPLEPLVCGLMARGKMSQAQVIEQVHACKNDLSKCPAIIAELSAM